MPLSIKSVTVLLHRALAKCYQLYIFYWANYRTLYYKEFANRQDLPYRPVEIFRLDHYQSKRGHFAI